MRVLVTVASRHHSTAEIGQLIAGRLTEAGLEVTLLPPQHIDSIAGYDGVVIGSAVYVGRWIETARRFAERFGPELKKRPVWLFSSGPVGDPPKPDGDPTDLPALLAATGARDHQVFAGRVERTRLGLGERVVVAAVRAPDGDFRPLSDISQWADGIARTLQQGAEASVQPLG